ncbi:hypothetical protein LINPERHAP1_LOCUS2062 [Linum perenne]
MIPPPAITNRTPSRRNPTLRGVSLRRRGPALPRAGPEDLDLNRKLREVRDR